MVQRFLRGLSPDGRAGLFGLGWSYLTHFVLILLRFGSSLLLTRLLVPDDYGVFGPAMAITILLELLSDIGIRPAIIKSPRGEEAAFVGTAWSVALVRSLFLAVLLFGLSWVLPMWYRQHGMTAEQADVLQMVLWAFTLRPLLFALQNPTLAVLHKRLDFRRPFFIDMGHSLTGLVATLLMCWWLRSVWGLVWGLLIGDLARVLVTHWLCPKAPRWRWDRTAAKELTHFGVPIFLNTLVYGVWIYVDRLGGSSLLAVDQMGLYYTAWALAEALDNLIARAADVFYSMLARLHGDARRQFYTKTLRRVSWAVGPVFVGGALLAPVVYRGLFAVKFHGAAILLGMLIVRLIPRLIAQVQYMDLMLHGRVIVATRGYLVALLVLAGLFVPAVQQFGVLGIALSAIVSMTAVTIVQTVAMARSGEGSLQPLFWVVVWTTLGTTGVWWLHA